MSLKYLRFSIIYILKPIGPNNFMKMDQYILVKCSKIRKKGRDCIYLTPMTFILEIGLKIACRDMEHIFLFQEKFMKEN